MPWADWVLIQEVHKEPPLDTKGLGGEGGAGRGDEGH